jgi:2-polyprenyl-3-methyl-5-hydroxy-6-metoxy-1,4-benzoquinol methylase
MTPATEIHRHCPVCEGAQASACRQKGELRLVRCGACGMVYATPVSREYATGEFYDRSGLPFYLSPAKLESDYSPVRFERELRLFRRFCPGGRVLDVGCSTGAFLYQLRQRFGEGYQIAGTDVTQAALDHAEKRGVPVIRRSFLDTGWEAAQYDAVTFWAVMEHLVQPVDYLRQAVRALKPGGRLFVLVPNYRCLAVRVLGAKYRYIMPDHVNYFTRETLRRLLRREPAMEVLAEGSTHWNPLVFIKDLRGSTARVADRERAQLLQRTTRWKQSPGLAPVKWLYHLGELGLGRLGLADNIYLVARKGERS